MRRPILLACVLLVVSSALGASVFRDEVASAGPQKVHKTTRRAGPPPTSVVFTNGLGTSTGNTIKIDPANNTVAVASSPTNPVTVTSASDGRDPAYYDMSNQWGGGTTILAGSDVPVPAGKTLVIENVSVRIQAPKGTQLELVSLGSTTNGELLYLVPVFMGSDGTYDYYQAFEPVRAYVKAGDILQGAVEATMAIPSGVGDAVFLVNGYLVNAS